MNNPVFVLATPGSIVHTDLLLMLEIMIFIWWPFWRKQIVHAFWVGLIGLRTAFQSRLAYGAPGSGDWWILHWASVYKTEEPLASTVGISAWAILLSRPTARLTPGPRCSFHQSLGAGEMRPVVPIRLADFFSSALNFCFQSSVRESVSLEEV